MDFKGRFTQYTHFFSDEDETSIIQCASFVFHLFLSSCLHSVSVCLNSMYTVCVCVCSYLYASMCSYGVVLRKLDLLKEAVEIFVAAAHALPLHWGAWLELCNLVTNIEMVYDTHTMQLTYSPPSESIHTHTHTHTHATHILSTPSESIYTHTHTHTHTQLTYSPLITRASTHTHTHTRTRTRTHTRNSHTLHSLQEHLHSHCHTHTCSA